MNAAFCPDTVGASYQLGTNPCNIQLLSSVSQQDRHRRVRVKLLELTSCLLEVPFCHRSLLEG